MLASVCDAGPALEQHWQYLVFPGLSVHNDERACQQDNVDHVWQRWPATFRFYFLSSSPIYYSWPVAQIVESWSHAAYGTIGDLIDCPGQMIARFCAHWSCDNASGKGTTTCRNTLKNNEELLIENAFTDIVIYSRPPSSTPTLLHRSTLTLIN